MARTWWMVIARPGRLWEAVEGWRGRKWRVRGQWAYWFFVLLATVIGSTMLWRAVAPDARARWGYPALLTQNLQMLRMAGVSEDRWYEVIPMTLGMYLGIRAALGLYRRFLTRGMPGRFRRWRLDGAARYLAGMAPVIVACVGGAALCERRRAYAPDAEQWLWIGGVAGMLLLALAVYEVTTLGFLRSAGATRGRMVLLAFVFPPAGFAAAAGMVVAAHWVFGYEMIAWRAMRV